MNITIRLFRTDLTNFEAKIRIRNFEFYMIVCYLLLGKQGQPGYRGKAAHIQGKSETDSHLERRADKYNYNRRNN